MLAPLLRALVSATIVAITAVCTAACASPASSEDRFCAAVSSYRELYLDQMAATQGDTALAMFAASPGGMTQVKEMWAGLLSDAPVTIQEDVNHVVEVWTRQGEASPSAENINIALEGLVEDGSLSRIGSYIFESCGIGVGNSMQQSDQEGVDSTEPSASADGSLPESVEIELPFTDSEGYSGTFRVSFVSPAFASDITNAAPGTTDLSATVQATGAVTNLTEGRVKAFQILTSLTAAYDASSPVCALPHDEEHAFINYADSICYLVLAQFNGATAELASGQSGPIATMANFNAGQYFTADGPVLVGVSEEGVDRVVAALNEPLGYALLSKMGDIAPFTAKCTVSVLDTTLPSGQSQRAVLESTDPALCDG